MTPAPHAKALQRARYILQGSAYLLILLGLVWASLQLQAWLHSRLQYHPAHWFLLAFGSCIYLLGMCLPFVPGIELGLMLMMLFGLPGIVVVYSATQIALNLAYHLGGRFGQGLEQRIQNGIHSPKTPRIIRFLMQSMRRSPALVFLLLLNLPGNAMIGGAGGISALYGILRVLPPGRFFIVALLATLPVPLTLLLGLWWGPAAG